METALRDGQKDGRRESRSRSPMKFYWHEQSLVLTKLYLVQYISSVQVHNKSDSAFLLKHSGEAETRNCRVFLLNLTS